MFAKLCTEKRAYKLNKRAFEGFCVMQICTEHKRCQVSRSTLKSLNGYNQN